MDAYLRGLSGRAEIDEMQCRFMPGHSGTTVAIVILSQLQKLLLTSNNQGLRLALGAFRTSPVASLYVEADEPSLYS